MTITVALTITNLNHDLQGNFKGKRIFVLDTYSEENFTIGCDLDHDLDKDLNLSLYL